MREPTEQFILDGWCVSTHCFVECLASLTGNQWIVEGDDSYHAEAQLNLLAGLPQDHTCAISRNGHYLFAQMEFYSLCMTDVAQLSSFCNKYGLDFDIYGYSAHNRGQCFTVRIGTTHDLANYQSLMFDRKTAEVTIVR